MRVVITTFIEAEQKEKLRSLADKAKQGGDKGATVARFVREAIDIFLTRELSNTEQDAVSFEADIASLQG